MTPLRGRYPADRDTCTVEAAAAFERAIAMPPADVDLPSPDEIGDPRYPMADPEPARSERG